MRTILSLSLRNLLRQKRRNLFLGLAISFGMMILVLANSFSHGISDNLLNRIIVYMTGHMSVSVMEDSSKNKLIIRDKNRIIGIIKKNTEGIKSVYEAVARFGRIIGNARGDNSIIVGVEVDKEFIDYLGQNLIKGDLKDFTSETIENPVVIYSDLAKRIGATYKDTIKMRTQTVTGQAQTARLTVVAILRSSNMFQGLAMYVPLKNFKPLIGLRPYETGELHINFKSINDPDHAKREAEKLYKLLQPGTAVISGSASIKKTAAASTMLGIAINETSRPVLKKNLTMVSGGLPAEKSEDKALISKKLASILNIKPGDPLIFKYNTKFENAPCENKYTVAGIFASDALPDKNIVLLNEKTFYKTYLQHLPENPGRQADTYMPDKKSALYALFAPEWKLLKRTATNDDLKKKLAQMVRTKWPGPYMDVRTMYESVDFILSFEFAMKMIALVAVLILFFIILIGVLNTLRMTIRERTREIGTVRAIGMQKTDVKYLFMFETFFLTAVSCIIGIVMAFIIMGIMRIITINTDSVLSILLVDRHLYFLPTATAIIGNFILILIMAAATAYFPARRASNLSAVEALRHFE
jgi:ABC-type lipoprotein release transport system permease subunit